MPFHGEGQFTPSKKKPQPLKKYCWDEKPRPLENGYWNAVPLINMMITVMQLSKSLPINLRPIHFARMPK